MQENQIAPPSNAEISVQSGTARRPLAVWLFLVILIAVTLLFISDTAQILSAIAKYWNTLNNSMRVGMAIEVTWRIAFLAALLFTTVGIFRRVALTRWLGVIALIGFGIWKVLQPDEKLYSNFIEQEGYQVATYFLMPMLLSQFVYAFGFSPKAMQYFGKIPSVSDRGHR